MPRERHHVAESEVLSLTLETGAVIPVSDNHQLHIGDPPQDKRECAEDLVDTFVLLQPAKDADQRRGRTTFRSRAVDRVVDAVVHQKEPALSESLLHHLKPGARRNHEERHAAPAVHPQPKALHAVHVGGNDRICFQEDAASEEMVHDAEQRAPHVQRGQERDFVDVIDDDVELLSTEPPEIGKGDMDIKESTPPFANDPDPVAHLLRRSTGIRGTEQRHLVSGSRNAREDVVQVCFGPSRERVGDILPVENENTHQTPRCTEEAARAKLTAPSPFLCSPRAQPDP